MNVSQGKILVVDDNLVNLDVLADFLDDDGYETLFATDGNSALERVPLARPDLILLDVLMPGISGFDVCKKLKEDEETRNIPIIFMTALSDVESKVRGFRLGAVDYITKPINMSEALARIRTHMTVQKLQNDLKKALLQEKELNRLKSRFISIVSHEFRTPLTSISSSAQLLECYFDRLTEEKKRVHLHKIQTQVQEMTALLDDVLFIGRSEAGRLAFNPELLNIVDFFQEIVEEFQSTCDEEHILNFISKTEREEGRFDKKLLRHILSNLLSNAIKYSPSGSVIEIGLESRPKETIFTVRDHGIGIPEEDQERLFSSFHRAGNVGTIQGAGLGLSIIKKCVDLHQGEIEFESEEGLGAIFTVTIPH